ncbi:hypothetical protein JCM8547_001710 [Rhodosporidiobolus lusitaniae]
MTNIPEELWATWSSPQPGTIEGGRPAMDRLPLRPPPVWSQVIEGQWTDWEVYVDPRYPKLEVKEEGEVKEEEVGEEKLTADVKEEEEDVKPTLSLAPLTNSPPLAPPSPPEPPRFATLTFPTSPTPSRPQPRQDSASHKVSRRIDESFSDEEKEEEKPLAKKAKREEPD